MVDPEFIPGQLGMLCCLQTMPTRSHLGGFGTAHPPTVIYSGGRKEKKQEISGEIHEDTKHRNFTQTLTQD